MNMTDDCEHFITQGRKDQKGSWCRECGVKVFDVDLRSCKDCKHSSKSIGTFNLMTCNKKLMMVPADMNVTYKITEGTCWKPDYS